MHHLSRGNNFLWDGPFADAATSPYLELFVHASNNLSPCWFRIVDRCAMLQSASGVHQQTRWNIFKVSSWFLLEDFLFNEIANNCESTWVCSKMRAIVSEDLSTMWMVGFVSPRKIKLNDIMVDWKKQDHFLSWFHWKTMDKQHRLPASLFEGLVSLGIHPGPVWVKRWQTTSFRCRDTRTHLFVEFHSPVQLRNCTYSSPHPFIGCTAMQSAGFHLRLTEFKRILAAYHFSEDRQTAAVWAHQLSKICNKSEEIVLNQVGSIHSIHCGYAGTSFRRSSVEHFGL